MDIEDVKDTIKESLVEKGYDADKADELIASYSESIYEDWENGCNCEEIAQSIVDSET